MSRVDLHVKVLDAAVVARAKRRGLDGVVYAPHFTRLDAIRDTARRFSDDELRVFPAREIFAGPWWARRHVLAIGMSEPVPDFLSLSGTLAELKRQDATILAPHPTFFSVSLTAAELREYREQFDAMEIDNPKFLPTHARRVRRLADQLDMPAFASSYAHLRSSVGEIWTEFDTSIRTEAALERALQAGAIARVGRRSGVRHITRRALEFGHLGWENSWQKFERVVLRGYENTHPRHPAYPDRFRELSVY